MRAVISAAVRIGCDRVHQPISAVGEIVAQNREIHYFLVILHDYVDKRVKGFILLLWQKYYMFSIQSIA